MNVNNYIFILYGPTGVGKTAFVEMLAREIPAEIVNIDMGQMYVPLTIGTAKPDWKNAMPQHHMFDVIDKPEHFTVVAYRDKLTKIINTIWSQGKLPILVGGSTFYVNSLFFPPRSLPPISKHVHTGNLWEKLHEIDPERAAQIHPTDTYRLERALDIWQSTGKKPSLFSPAFNPIADFYLLCLTRDREDLVERIDDRALEMLDAGWIDEVKKLQGTEWERFIIEKKIIGYDDILIYLKNPTPETYDQLVVTIQIKTRAYAKRQMTFWRMLEKKIKKDLAETSTRSVVVECNLTHIEIHRYIKQLIYQIRTILKEK